MNIIYIDKLQVMASIGIHDWEKKCLQRLIFDLQLSYRDNFFKSNLYVSTYLDYTEINRIILNIINNRHFLLIEDVAEILIDILIDRFPMVKWIFIRVNKPDAISNANNVGFCMKRRNKNKFRMLKLYTGWKRLLQNKNSNFNNRV